MAEIPAGAQVCYNWAKSSMKQGNLSETVINATSALYFLSDQSNPGDEYYLIDCAARELIGDVRRMMDENFSEVTSRLNLLPGDERYEYLFIQYSPLYRELVGRSPMLPGTEGLGDFFPDLKTEVDVRIQAVKYLDGLVERIEDGKEVKDIDWREVDIGLRSLPDRVYADSLRVVFANIRNEADGE